MELKKGELESLNKTEYEKICDECLLNDAQKDVLLGMIKGMTIVEMSMKFGISTANISRIKNKIKKKITRMVL